MNFPSHSANSSLVKHYPVLPSKFVPARLWKEASGVLVPLMLPAVNVESSTLPPKWHEVQICTIPKTAIVKLPKQLRPISLLHPGSKLLATMVAHRVLPKVEQYLLLTTMGIFARSIDWRRSRGCLCSPRTGKGSCAGISHHSAS